MNPDYTTLKSTRAISNKMAITGQGYNVMPTDAHLNFQNLRWCGGTTFSLVARQTRVAKEPSNETAQDAYGYKRLCGRCGNTVMLAAPSDMPV